MHKEEGVWAPKQPAPWVRYCCTCLLIMETNFLQVATFASEQVTLSSSGALDWTTHPPVRSDPSWGPHEARSPRPTASEAATTSTLSVAMMTSIWPHHSDPPTFSLVSLQGTFLMICSILQSQTILNLIEIDFICWCISRIFLLFFVNKNRYKFVNF